MQIGTDGGRSVFGTSVNAVTDRNGYHARAGESRGARRRQSPATDARPQPCGAGTRRLRPWRCLQLADGVRRSKTPRRRCRRGNSSQPDARAVRRRPRGPRQPRRAPAAPASRCSPAPARQILEARTGLRPRDSPAGRPASLRPRDGAAAVAAHRRHRACLPCPGGPVVIPVYCPKRERSWRRRVRRRRRGHRCAHRGDGAVLSSTIGRTA
jgi:hypothetical protein